MKFPISISKEFGHITIKLLFIKLRIKYKCKLAAVMCVKNEEYHLPTFLKHIENYVDFIVAVDDGSTDSTYEILNNHPLCKEVVKLPVHASKDWNEADNRILVMNLAKKHGADWVLCCDPDERFQTNFLKKLRKIIADDKKQSCYHVKFRELWGRYDVYRADGVWNKKEKGLLFPLPKEMNFNYKQNQHIHWHPSEIRNHVNLKYNLYHMKMIKREEREKRKDLYNAIDPNCEMQKIGYNYLTDEEGIKLVSIPPKKEYDYSLIPEDLKTYAE